MRAVSTKGKCIVHLAWEWGLLSYLNIIRAEERICIILAGPFKTKILEGFFLKSSLDDNNVSRHINYIVSYFMVLHL